MLPDTVAEPCDNEEDNKEKWQGPTALQSTENSLTR